MSKQSVIAVGEYMALPPNQTADPEQLLGVVRRIGDSKRRFDSLVAANGLAEAALQRPVGSTVQRDLVGKARSRLGMTNEIALQPLAERSAAARLVTALPLINGGPTVESIRAVRTLSLQHLAVLGAAVKGSVSSPKTAGLRGMIGDQLGVLAINAGKDIEVSGRPSFERQDRSTTPVDDVPYRFDLTVNSTGRYIDRGEYHVQLTNNPAIHAPSHPAIVAVNLRDIFGLAPDQYIDAALEGLPVNGRQQLPASILIARNRLLQQLQAHGPSVRPPEVS